MKRTPPMTVAAVALAAALAVSACSGATSAGQTPAKAASSGGASWKPSTTPTKQASAAAGCRTVVVAAGDIVNRVDIADQTGHIAAAQHPAHVLALGDNQYESGTLDAYRAKYDHTSWGRLKPITDPVPGNHDYKTPGAAGYFAYFGHPPPYYAFDAGCGWRGYALNSEISLGPQITWLRRDLAAHPAAAVLAYWHKPRWSSGSTHGSDPDMQPFWTALAGRTGVVVNGHEHNYERFAPIGHLREFVAGTGGSSTYPFGSPAAGSQRRIAHTPGVLRLDLRPHAAYHWEFLNTAGTTLDSGVS